MMRIVFVPALLALMVGSANSQQREAKGAQAKELAKRQQFRLPAVGAELPHVRVYDEQGREFNTAALKGSYAVLVFGCLT